METEIAFLIPAILDHNFKKAQIFCNSRFFSDLAGKEKIFPVFDLHSCRVHSSVL